MELKEYRKKYQGKCYKYENNRTIMYMKIVKIGDSENSLNPYFIIYDFIIYSTLGKNWNTYTENSEHRDLVPPEIYNWKRTTKSNFEAAKRRCPKSQLENNEKK